MIVLLMEFQSKHVIFKIAKGDTYAAVMELLLC